MKVTPKPPSAFDKCRNIPAEMRDDVVRHIERSLLGDTLEEDGSIGEVEVK